MSIDILEDGRNKVKMSLPIELLSEPYSFSDCHYRAEIIVPRPRFKFQITQCERSVQVAGCTIAVRDCSSQLPIKNTSNVSLLTIYDTYGLEIALKFLDHLFDKLKEQPTCRLSLYLKGCAMVLDIDSGESPTREKFQDRLNQLDRASNFPTVAITFMPLPIELVAKIVCSLRISKAISKLVRSERERTIPTLDLLRSSGQRWCYLETMRCVIKGRRYGCSVTREGDRYRVEGGEGQPHSAFTAKCVGLSLRDYRSYYVSRGCDGKRAMANLLSTIRTSQLSIHDTCIWIVQLSYDLRPYISVILTEEELRGRLDNLIAEWIELQK